ncbi:two-component regulator propeller domain-containing protein [Gramella sp. AN32]|uniref:Two-component regulator propeller domain-containing protein n=1 Tax=Christiangramia antarctica TaxID=2058158 RepID=A0ABW5X5C4_9FLAO|nr:two-component regulator propeller domain-containing protein [Gramella sp. AN32]MCM4157468.1 hypothetical protein [Gramella sp. AN32]
MQLNVKDLAIDNEGFLWAGTEDGLHKFNSYEFKALLHDPEDNSSIPDDHIRGLLYTNDTLWIATNSKGIVGFEPSKMEYFNLDSKKINTNLNTGYDVFFLDDSTLLFALKNYIVKYERAKKTYTVIALPKNNRDIAVTSVLPISDNEVWFGTTSQGILKFNLNNNKIEETKILEEAEDIYLFEANDLIMAGTKSGLFQLHKDKKPDLIFETASVKCFYMFNPETLMLGTEIGLYKFNFKTEKFTSVVFTNQFNRTLKTFDINNIIGDDKGNIWLGTEGDGLIHYNSYQKKFNTIKIKLDEYPNKENISSFQFLKGRDSTLWIGSKWGIVKYFHKNDNFKLYNIPYNALIYTVAKDLNGQIWSGGFTTGLLKYNSETDSFKKISSGNLKDNDVINIIPVSKEKLWVCTWTGGIYEYNIKKEEFNEILIDEKRINRARTSLIDSEGSIWLGTEEGVYKVNKESEIKRFFSKDSENGPLSGNRIFAIKEDRKGNIWLGTNSGLTKLNAKTHESEHFFKQKGLPNDFIYSILIAPDDNIWVSTNYGISELDIKNNTFKNFTSSDGLQNNEFNGKAGYQDEFGNFYFGGISGINIFKPEEIIENPYIPRTHIESIELFNKPIDINAVYTDTLEFRSDENVITLNFTGISYLNPEKSFYTYKMEGFDANWRPATKNRSTTYTNLNPGNYTFKVKSSNDEGKWNENIDTIFIKIVPPWYNTLWFKILLVLLFLLATRVFYLYKTRKIKKDNLKLEMQVNTRTKEIKQKNKDLEKAYSDVEKQRNNIEFLMRELTHRVKNNLQIISSLLNIQANNMEEEQSSSALRVAKNRILTISQIENKTPHDNGILEIDHFIRHISEVIIESLSDDENLKFKTVFRLNSNLSALNFNATMIGLILNELITNTTKYAFEKTSETNELLICSTVEGNYLILIIKDNGKGYQQDDITKNNTLGVELVREMVEQLDGNILVNSFDGTENIIRIPI